MNMRNRSYAILALAALAFAGCNKVEDFNCNPDNALQIESVGGVSQYALMQAQPAGKAVIDDNTLPGSEATQGIGIFVTAQDGSAYMGKTSGYSNVKYAYNGSKWSTTTPIYLSNTVGKLYGYFPYNAGATNLKGVPVASSLNGTDYLYAEQREVSISKKSVSLQMNHALARLHLTLKKGEKYKAAGVISGITLKSTAIDATGTMDITTGEVTATKAKTDKGVVELTASGSLYTGDQTYDILLVPADGSDIANPIDIIISIDGATAGVTLSGDNALDIRSGIQCNATLEIQDTGIKVASVGVGEWGEGGCQTVQINGHTVTVKLSDDAADAGIADNLIAQCKSDGGSVIIESYSKNEVKPLIVRINNGSLIAPTENGSVSTFMISDITEDITATLAYAKTFKVTLSFKADVTPVSGYFENYPAQGVGEVLEGRTTEVTVTVATNIPGYHFENIVCDEMVETGNTIVLKNLSKNFEVIANYKFYDYPLPGVFTVADDGQGNVRKVQFARGNLWYQKGVFHNEDEQYTFSSSDWKEDGHISHFMWCKTAKQSVKLRYEEQGATGFDNLFTNASPTEPDGNFAVSGQKGFWRALSGGGNGEWKYLINKDNECGQTIRSGKYKCGVNVCNCGNCLILLPDDWKWGENGVGDNWQDGGYPETSTEGKVTWKTMEAAGAVCLPAAGFRDGNGGITYVSSVGYNGYYWSSTPNDYNYAYYLYFYSGYVSPTGNYYRYYACAVRLVTESK